MVSTGRPWIFIVGTLVFVAFGAFIAIIVPSGMLAGLGCIVLFGGGGLALCFSAWPSRRYRPGRTFSGYRGGRQRVKTQYTIAFYLGLLLVAGAGLWFVLAPKIETSMVKILIQGLLGGLGLAVYGYRGRLGVPLHEDVDETANLSLRSSSVISRTEKISASFRNFSPTNKKYAPAKGNLLLGVHPTMFSIVLNDGRDWLRRAERYEDIAAIGIRTASGSGNEGEHFLALKMIHGGSYVLKLALGENATDPLLFLRAFLSSLDSFLTGTSTVAGVRRRRVPSQEAAGLPATTHQSNAQRAPGPEPISRYVDVTAPDGVDSAADLVDPGRQIDLAGSFTASIKVSSELPAGRSIDL